MLFSSTEFWNLIFGVVIKSFKIFLLVALSFLTSFNLSANDTFFSIEKKDTRVYDVANVGSKLSKSNLFNVSWVNNITGHRSVNNALNFWENTSKEFEHLIDGDLYLKFDKVSGNLLFGNHKTKEILGFYEGALNVSTVNKKGLDGVLGKLKAYHGVGSPSYINLNVSSPKVENVVNPPQNPVTRRSK